MEDPATLVLAHTDTKFHAHVRGVYGDCDESEGVLSITALLDVGPYAPDGAVIIVGSPTASPLIGGYIPELGCFSCGADGAERIIAALQKAVDLIKVARS